MLDHYLALGGNEVVNSARAYGYAVTADCTVDWLEDPECGTIGVADGVGEYTYADIVNAPWYDPDDPDTTSRFYGLYGIDLRGLSDSTRTAAVTQKTTDGAVVSGYRHASREVRVRAWMTAAGEDAIEVGMTWLRNVLEPNACGQHGTACGDADAAFFVSCPPLRDDETDEEYAALVSEYRRFLHSVRCVSGPFVVAERRSQDGIHVGRLVEFTLLAGVPWVYGVPKEIDVPPLVPSVMQDVAYNLIPYPSAELTPGTAVIVATNYASNPSLETNFAGWTAGADAPLPAAQVTSGRVVGELAAVGTASFRVVFAPTSAGAGGNFYADAAVTGFPTAAGYRFSVNIWAAQVVMAGAPVRGTMEVVAIWRTGTTIDRVDVLGTIPLDGGYISAKSITPPAGSDNVFVRVRANMTSWSNGDVIRLYADALAVTNP